MTKSKPVDIDYVQFKYDDLLRVWADLAKTMRAILAVPPDGLHCYDLPQTLEDMNVVYTKLVAHSELLKHAKGEF